MIHKKIKNCIYKWKKSHKVLKNSEKWCIIFYVGYLKTYKEEEYGRR